MTQSFHAEEPVTISVVTPCYNGARYLRDTLGSALAQSKAPLEVIVVDDGSTDDSAAVAESVGGCVRVIRQSNQGESVARNRGLEEARGSHVLFLDADDLLAPEALAHLASALRGRRDTVAIMGCVWFRTTPAEAEKTRLFEYDGFFPEIIQGNLAPVHCWLAPVDLVKAAGGFLGSLQWFEDWDMWWRVALRGASLVTVDYPGALYRQHPTSQFATISSANRARGHAILINRMGQALLNDPALLAAHGDTLLWALWTAVTRAREAGVPWRELEEISNTLLRVASAGPAHVRNSTFARTARLVGVRGAIGLQRLSGAVAGRPASTTA
ncbi:MAG: glycosyltransferase family 2 protein [Acidobacteria bacterium]|nr:glycosyltransferase family 2 protein [Acidobacteriota bacterium]